MKTRAQLLARFRAEKWVQKAKVLVGDADERLADIEEGCVQCVVTSPPYWGLRDYDSEGQLGMEPTPGEYVAHIISVFQKVRRVLADDGVVWLNLGDSYTSGNRSWRAPNKNQMRSKVHAERMDYRPKTPPGCKPKDLVGIPWRVALALQSDGWYLRADIIWHKPNPMPESVTDRPTNCHEYLFLLSKQPHYYYDADAIREPHGDWADKDKRYRPGAPVQERSLDEPSRRAPTGQTGMKQITGLARRQADGRNKRSVWTVNTKPYKGAHFAVFPPKLIEPCVLAGSREGDLVLDPFAGSGTTLAVAKRHFRRSIGIELNPEYAELAYRRLLRVPLVKPLFKNP